MNINAIRFGLKDLSIEQRDHIDRLIAAHESWPKLKRYVDKVRVEQRKADGLNYLA